jgi:hypothetical protein
VTLKAGDRRIENAHIEHTGASCGLQYHATNPAWRKAGGGVRADTEFRDDRHGIHTYPPSGP